MADKKKPDDFPKLQDLIDEVRKEEDAKKNKLSLMTLDKLADMIVGANMTVQLKPITNDSGWDNDKDLTPSLLQEALTKPQNMNKIDQIFSKLLKPVPKPDQLLEVVIDPDKDMHWHPKEGGTLLASQMETRHLFFSLRMLFNKAVPPEYRIDTDKTSASTVTVKDNQIKHAIKVLFYQIGKRDNLTEDQLTKLTYMARICREQL